MSNKAVYFVVQFRMLGCFKIPEYEVASVTVIKQVKLSCIHCRSASYAWFQRQGASCPGQFILPPALVLIDNFFMIISLVSNYLNMKLHQ